MSKESTRGWLGGAGALKQLLEREVEKQHAAPQLEKLAQRKGGPTEKYSGDARIHSASNVPGTRDIIARVLRSLGRRRSV